KEDVTADVRIGPFSGKLPLLSMRWARPVQSEKWYNSYAMISGVSKALKVGDVIVVRAVAEKKDLFDDDTQWNAKVEEKLPSGTGVQLYRLEQEPELQSALVSIDPWRNYMVAMVGGYDFDANEYNRAFQACRQPGSGFKPIEYSAAFESQNY